MEPFEYEAYISYSPTDGDWVRTELLSRLQETGIRYVDHLRFVLGRPKLQEVERAILESQWTVVVLTPAFMGDTWGRFEAVLGGTYGLELGEWRVLPVIVEPCDLSPYLASLVSVDLAEEGESGWARLIDALAPHAHVAPRDERTGPPGRFAVESLPSDYVPRPGESESMVAHLLDRKRNSSSPGVTAFLGAGGNGKTTLARAVCHDPRIQEAFHDGILWTTLGQEPDLLNCLAQTYASLTGERPAFVNVEDAASTLARCWEEQQCLLVIDDVWSMADLSPFLRDGGRCAHLITTRDSSVYPLDTLTVNVDAMQEGEARLLLGAGLPPQETDILSDLAGRLGEWPLLLKLVNRALREKVSIGLTVTEALAEVDEELSEYGLTAFDISSPEERTQAVSATLNVSLRRLDEADRERYRELCIFPENIDIPLSAVEKLWCPGGAITPVGVRRLCQQFYGVSLLHAFDARRRTIRIHRVVRAFLRQEQEGQQALHERLLNAYHAGAWSDLPRAGAYIWRHLAYHLLQADRRAELWALLADPSWMQAKLEVTDIYDLLSDYRMALDQAEQDGASCGQVGGPTGEELALIQGALQLSAHVLVLDKSQLWSQVSGRLRSHDAPGIQALLKHVREKSRDPWLCPMTSALMAPGGPLLHTLTGHHSSVRAVAITADGKRALSASEDHTLKVWDLVQGKELRTLVGHGAGVSSVALLAGEECAISSSYDRTLKVWRLDSGQEVCTLQGHTDSVNAVAVIPDQQCAVSASDDGTIRVWDLQTGQTECILTGHTDRVTTVAVTPDGRRAVSGSRDRTIKVWDLEAGTPVLSLDGHAGPIVAVAVVGDGRRVVSAAYDRTLKVWDVETGTLVHTLEGHTRWVRSAAVIPDAQAVISASDDRTLRVWDLGQGALLRSLEGHATGVSAVAVAADGRRAVSASDDGMLKIWDLETGWRQGVADSHLAQVRSVVVLPDKGLAISGSEDHTLKMWSLQRGSAERTLRGHTAAVSALALTPDGEGIVSASYDHTLRIWSLADGETVSTLAGHTAGITSLAVSAQTGTVVSASYDHSLGVWSVEHARLVHMLKHHRDWVTCVIVTPDGRSAISGSRDRQVCVWDLESAECVTVLDGHTGTIHSLAVTLDGQRVVSASRDRTLKVWDLSTGAEAFTLEGHARGVQVVSLASDGKRVLSASYDGTVKIWDLESGTEVCTLPGHTDWVRSVVPVPDRNWVVSVADDNSLRLWDLESEQIIASFTGNGAILCCAVARDQASPGDYTLVAGEATGHVHFLHLEELVDRSGKADGGWH